jgi:hypothetical protein
MIPPEYIPDADDWLVLWEVKDWRWAAIPRTFPNDPYLLRPLGGDLYSVEEHWEGR